MLGQYDEPQVCGAAWADCGQVMVRARPNVQHMCSMMHRWSESEARARPWAAQEVCKLCSIELPSAATLYYPFVQAAALYAAPLRLLRPLALRSAREQLLTAYSSSSSDRSSCSSRRRHRQKGQR